MSNEKMQHGRRRSGAAWLVLSVTATAVAALVPLLFKQRYYYVDDSQVSYFGRFYHYGEMLTQGNWPLLNPAAWRSGDYIIESSWGLFSPIMMLLGVLALHAANALLFMTAIKVVFLAVFAGGTFVLSRSYGVSARLACLAGMAVPFAGFTMYMDAPTWSVGLMSSALMPWTWWGLRRAAAGHNPWIALVSGYLLITLGYISATLALAVVVLACLLETSLHRNWRGLGKVLVSGALFALVVVTVNLAGYLSAGVTSRQKMDIRNVGQQVADAGGYLSSPLPTAMAGVKAWWGPVLEQPMMYISWLVPLLVLVDWSRLRRASAGLSGLWFMLVASLLWTLGPSNLGPIRVQMRMMPFVVLGMVVLLVVLLDRARVRELSATRLWGMLAWTALAIYLTIAQRPQVWTPAVTAGLLVALGLFLLWWLARRQPTVTGLPAVACLLAVVWTVGLVGVQHHFYPRSPGPDLNMPALAADMKTQLPEAVRDTFVVGDVTPLVLRNPEASESLLLANTWYVNPNRVQNLYSAIGYRTYNRRYCFRFHGDTCPEALETLFSTEPVTGRQRVDLLSVSTVVVLESALEESELSEPPPGWREVGRSPVSVTWTRTDPVPVAGGVVWSSPGTDVEVIEESSTQVRVAVRDVADEGGTIVLSRLDWPGYSVEGGTLAEPVDDYLVTVDIPPRSVGETILIGFRPPGWAVEIASGAVAVVGGGLWCLLLALLGRRRRWDDEQQDADQEEPADQHNPAHV